MARRKRESEFEKQAHDEEKGEANFLCWSYDITRSPQNIEEEKPGFANSFYKECTEAEMYRKKRVKIIKNLGNVSKGLSLSTIILNSIQQLTC